MVITIKMSELKALLLFVPRKDVRYYLNSICVRVQGDKAQLTASDGATLACLQAEHYLKSSEADPGHIEMLIPIDVLELASKQKTMFVDIDLVGSTVNQIPFTPIDSRYPDFVELLDNAFDDCRVDVNGELLHRVFKAFKMLSEAIAKPKTNSKCMLFSTNNFLAVIMAYKHRKQDYIEPFKIINLG